jgi:hypothetical protein
MRCFSVDSATNAAIVQLLDGRRGEPRDDLVEHEQPRLAVDECGVAWKERGVEVTENRRNVERLIGGPVAITGGVQRGEQRKGCEARREHEWPRHGPSSTGAP